MGIVGDILGGSPEAPDPTSTIDAQKKAQQITQFTPQGTLEYGTVDNDGNFVARTGSDALQVTESDFQQAFREGQEDIALGLLPQLSSELGSYRSGQDVESMVDIPLMRDFSGDIQRLEDETYSAGMRRLKPQMEQGREALVQNLADRGVPLSSEQAQRELDRFDQAQNDALQDLTFRSIQAGRDEQNRLASLSSAMRAQQMNEGLTLANLEQQQRAQQFGEIGALGGFAAPFSPLNAPTVDAAGIINQAYQNEADAAGNSMALTGDLASAAALAFAASDSRLKENIVPYDEKNGFKRYIFNYIGSNVKYVGVMAQDLLNVIPDAVTTLSNGYYGVFYSKLGFDMEVFGER